MGWPAVHREAMVAAAVAREELDLDSLGRIDAFEALVAAGLKVMFRPLKGVAAFYEPARPAASAGVLINSHHPLALQRYSAAHEYGHHVFGHGAQIDRDGEPHLPRANVTHEERLAEAFASWFLMPPEAARTARARLGIDRPALARDAYALALRLGVSYKAMCVHLPSLKLAAPATSKAWFDVPLKTIKQELTDTPPPGGWRNDVWVLNRADADAPLVVRCGDRLLVDHPANPQAAVADGISTHELPAVDLLSRPRLCLDVACDALPGRRELELAYGDGGPPVRFALHVERPRRGRYLSRIPAT